MRVGERRGVLLLAMTGAARRPQMKACSENEVTGLSRGKPREGIPSAVRAPTIRPAHEGAAPAYAEAPANAVS